MKWTHSDDVVEQARRFVVERGTESLRRTAARLARPIGYRRLALLAACYRRGLLTEAEYKRLAIRRGGIIGG